VYLNGPSSVAVTHEVPNGIRFTIYDMPGFTGKAMSVNTVEQLEAYARALGIDPRNALKRAVDARRLDIPSAASWIGILSGNRTTATGGLMQAVQPIHQAPNVLWFSVMDGPPDKRTKAVIDSLEALSQYTVWVNAQIDPNVKLSQDALGHAKAKGWLDDMRYYSWIDFTFNPDKYSGKPEPKPTWLEEMVNAFKGGSGQGTKWVIIGGLTLAAIVVAVAASGRKPAQTQSP